MAVPNIKDLLNPVKKEEISVAATGEILNDPYTEEQLRDKWKAFVDQLKADGNQTGFIMLNRSWQKKDHEIHLILDNLVQEETLNEMKPDLLEYLRRGLRNQYIQITSSIQEGQTTRKIYTDQDKLQHLSEKHPVIHDLRKRFGLDTSS